MAIFVDELTGKRQWKAAVTDPHEPNAKRRRSR